MLDFSDSPVVSVIMPVYNCASFVGDAIKSVLCQTFESWELIIVDDCSSDESRTLVRRYADSESRITAIYLDRNGGAALARNIGIEAARGRYIAFLDSDDKWHPDKLEVQISFMQLWRRHFTYSYYESMTETGEPTGGIMRPSSRISYKELLKSNQIGCLTAVYDSKPHGKFYMPLIRKRQDYGLWLKILKSEDYAYCIPESLALYRTRSGSISSNKIEMLRYNWKLFRNVENLPLFKAAYYLFWNIIKKVFK